MPADWILESTGLGTRHEQPALEEGFPANSASAGGLQVQGHGRAHGHSTSVPTGQAQREPLPQGPRASQGARQQSPGGGKPVLGKVGDNGQGTRTSPGQWLSPAPPGGAPVALFSAFPPLAVCSYLPVPGEGTLGWRTPCFGTERTLTLHPVGGHGTFSRCWLQGPPCSCGQAPSCAVVSWCWPHPQAPIPPPAGCRHPCCPGP